MLWLGLRRSEKGDERVGSRTNRLPFHTLGDDCLKNDRLRKRVNHHSGIEQLFSLKGSFDGSTQPPPPPGDKIFTTKKVFGCLNRENNFSVHLDFTPFDFLPRTIVKAENGWNHGEFPTNSQESSAPISILTVHEKNRIESAN